jgi:hypothetical protein
MEIILNRAMLFFFYTLMAWASLFRPKDGNEMINDSLAGKTNREYKEIQASRGNYDNEPK